MPDSLGQDKRIAQLNTPLGKDKLTLVSFACSEGVSEKFQITIEAASDEKGLNFDSAIGQNCTITVDMLESGKRYFDGLLTEAHWLGGREKGTHRYRLVLRPWLWLLSHRRNSFIHHEKTVPEIIEKVFGDHGFAVFSNNLSRGYPTLEYCVQYRESDMDFVCRLMEEYGISYYFKHSDGEHKLIMTDEMSTFEAIGGGSRWYLSDRTRAPLRQGLFLQLEPGTALHLGQDQARRLRLQEIGSGSGADRKFDPPFDPGMLEVFDYPGRYVESGDGQKIAQAWRDMERSNDHHFNAEGECVTCFPGALVTLEDKSESGFDGEYLALREAGFYIERIQIFRGKAIRHGGYGGKQLLKLFAAAGRLDPEEQDTRVYLDGPAGSLKHPLEEWNRKEDEILFYLGKHLRYADAFAAEELKRREGLAFRGKARLLVRRTKGSSGRNASGIACRSLCAPSSTSSTATSSGSASWTAGTDSSFTSSRGSGSVLVVDIRLEELVANRTREAASRDRNPNA